MVPVDRPSDFTTNLQRSMQEEGIPVGLERPPGRAKVRARPAPVRLEGVRLIVSVDGESILVGKSGRDNQRLTFKLASPEDFWLHARDAKGAHVILRNDRRSGKPSVASLREAAEAAAWYSDARAQSWVEVQWTKRKYVRKIPGAPPGTVRIKRCETLRVRPRQPTTATGGVC